jgi:hypothetical protein
MDVTRMIAELRAEREALTSAMAVLESIANSRGKRRRGRPPAWLASVSAGAKSVAAAGPKRVLSAATKKKMALAQRKRWAAARKAKES